MNYSTSNRAIPVHKKRHSFIKTIGLAFFVLLTMNGCALTGASEPAWKAAVAGDGKGNPALINITPWVVTNLPKSRSGNRSEYSVFDVKYSVLESAENFREWGVASWYGRKFHGRQTASGEIYDMYLATAAHRQLPLPTFVRVTRLDNDRSIVVKVNDRGPFVDDRVIDLSYAAAVELGMLETGTAEVYIEAISSHVIDSSPVTATVAQAAVPQTTQSKGTSTVAHYVQVGAYTDRTNADFMVSELERRSNLPVLLDFESARELYRVRVGPLSEGRQMEDALVALSSVGIEGYKVTAQVR